MQQWWSFSRARTAQRQRALEPKAGRKVRLEGRAASEGCGALRNQRVNCRKQGFGMLQTRYGALK